VAILVIGIVTFLSGADVAVAMRGPAIIAHS
jgi:hypothetical protein